MVGASFGGPADSCFASQVVFEALHNLEPRGYVVGWIIAISLLVGILIFLLLAVLLWKVSGDRESPGSLHPDTQLSCFAGVELLERGFMLELPSWSKVPSRQ